MHIKMRTNANIEMSQFPEISPYKILNYFFGMSSVIFLHLEKIWYLLSLSNILRLLGWGQEKNTLLPYLFIPFNLALEVNPLPMALPETSHILYFVF